MESASNKPNEVAELRAEVAGLRAKLAELEGRFDNIGRRLFQKHRKIDNDIGRLNARMDQCERKDFRRRRQQKATAVGKFVESRCVILDGSEVAKDDLYLEYRLWCRSRNIDCDAMNVFARNLRAVSAHITTRRVMINGKQTAVFAGIKMTGIPVGPL